VLNIRGFDTYFVLPRDPRDLDLLIDSVRGIYEPGAMDVVVGLRGSLAPPTYCNGLVLPLVAFDQVWSFDRDSLIGELTPPPSVPEPQFREHASAVLEYILQIADNAGATDEHRALNYLAVRYDGVYRLAAEQSYTRDAFLSQVLVRRDPLSTTSGVVRVIFGFVSRETDVTEWFSLKVEVGGEWPFLVTRLSPYFAVDTG